MMGLDIQDLTRLLGGLGLSAAMIMGFWAAWLKTRDKSFRVLAYGLGPAPGFFVVATLVARLTLATGTVHEFEIYAQGSEKESVVRVVEIPVMDAELRHELQVEPMVEVVSIKSPGGEPVAQQSAPSGNVLRVGFDARGEGKYLLEIRIAPGVEKVRITGKEIR